MSALAPIRVLIVDDIAETRDHLAKLLSFEPDIAVIGSVGSGQEALNLAASAPVDVLLLDINMPGMDGIATAEQLSLRVPTASIIMMSVQGEPDYLRRAMLAGAREFLVKPFSSDELAGSIRQVHQRERQKLDRVASSQPAARLTAMPSPSRRTTARWSRSSRPRAAWGAPRLRSTSRSPRGPRWARRSRSSMAACSSATWECCSISTPRISRSPMSPARWPAANSRLSSRPSSTTAPASACSWRRPARRWPSS